MIWKRIEMPFYDYHFISHWRITGPIQVVYDILKDGAHYSRWWKPAYVSSQAMDDCVESLVRAKLPYTLTFITQLIQENPPYELMVQSTGELVGTGLWKLKAVGDETHIEFYWDVQAIKPLVRWLSLFLKPVFKWNHSWVMKQGEMCLQKEVDRLFPRD
ncbi:MAG: hypothetical protein IPJ69_08565 [Deltaproteobacteria bacterium]|nr:MAG: hypothetical protein IPJ69_08565 [Deltaproteobacteria bacterium]